MEHNNRTPENPRMPLSRRNYILLAAGFAVVNHGLGHPVLGRAAGVEILHLGQDTGLQPLLLFNVAQLQKGSPPDQFIRRGENFTHP